jgi:catechol 2,3-dioxygenase-like lactoylglutathione lyase family enzyme
MLTGTRMTTILAVVDLERARQFYEGKLGLPRGERRQDGSVAYQLQSSILELQPRQEPSHNPYTAVGFEVADIAREVKELEGRGVRFEDYDLPDLKTVGHICQLGSDKAAWFKDPDGNILCIHQDVSGRKH